jgi:hypothetical protein
MQGTGSESLFKKFVLIFVVGEPAGTRTQDPVIKSHVLYRLSYGLSRCARGV